MGACTSCARENKSHYVADENNWNSQYAHIARERTSAKRALSKSVTRSPTQSFNISRALSTLTISPASRTVNGYSLEKLLGQGAFGSVFLATRAGEEFAVKVMKRPPPQYWHPMMKKSGQTNFNSIKAEIATMKKIDHPNCVHMFDVIIDEMSEEILIVLEFVEGGPSQRAGKDGQPAKLAERTVWSHTRHLLLGLEYLHMNNIVHRDIKPENLLVSRGEGVLKIADFGTSCFAEVEGKKGKTVGTPMFFAPEMCTSQAAKTYDDRVLDLWAVGATLHVWVSGKLPFTAPTTMLLMQAIAAAPEVSGAPSEASTGLGSVISGLLTRDPATRLTLNQLRHHAWLTAGGKATLPLQPVDNLAEATPEEIEQAFSNRQAIAYMSAAGPGTLGRDIGVVSDWRRMGPNTIRKRTTKAEADFWRAIQGSGHLSMHIPVVYSIERVGGADGAPGALAGAPAAAAQVAPEGDGALHDVHMQDLAGGMILPCAMRFAVGVRTVVAADLSAAAQAQTSTELFDRMHSLDPALAAEFLSPAEQACTAVCRARYLEFLDVRSSSRSLGFRIDGAKTMGDEAIEDLPPPPGHNTLGTVRDEGDVRACLEAFLQSDADLAGQVCNKVAAIAAALERSTFFGQHVFLRAALLLTYDDAAREKRVELKLINFAFCYRHPELEGRPRQESSLAASSTRPERSDKSFHSEVSADLDADASGEGKGEGSGKAEPPAVTSPGPLFHVAPWDGTATSHEDGFLFGIQNLARLMQQVAVKLKAEAEVGGAKGSKLDEKSRLSKYLDSDEEDEN